MFKTKLADKLGIDKAIAYTIFSRTIQGLGGVGTVLFIARNLSKNEQGYYYTFSSILAIQVFFELGLSTVITQYVAHEIVHLKWVSATHLEGDEVYQSRLASLLHFCFKWFSRISAFLFVLLMVAGYYFFSSFGGKGDANIHWQFPWAILALTTSCFLVIDPLMAFLEGMGKVKDIARMRLIQQTVYIFSLIIFLLCGFKLYSSALATFLAFLSIFIGFFTSGFSNILRNLWKLKGNWAVSYRKEIFPYQWKIAVSWISGYFIFQLFNPVLFATEGKVVAGQMGMSLAALNGVLGLSMSWISTKAPLFSNLIAQKNYTELDNVFFTSFKKSVGIVCLGLLVFFGGVFALRYLGLPLGNRFLPLRPLGFMCMSFLFNCIAFSLATYLRCHKAEPLLSQAVVFAICSALSTVLLGHFFGVMGVTAGYFILGLTIGLPWVVIVFITKRKQWHQA
ncbi:lipopolysaccharide biosynthesis protein [Mucilaginibacter sp.]